MAKHLRYFGEFLSVEGHHNRVALYQESDTAFTPQELDFPADSPLVIEWGEKDKEDVILGSSATLQIISPTDRKFIDLYSIKYGDIRMDVWRDGEFFWTGCIDTEFYTEPYERLNDYIVSLSFSDFGILSREKFDMGVGFKRIKEIIAQAVYKTQCVRTSIESDFDDSFAYSTWVEAMDWSKFMLSTTYPVKVLGVTVQKNVMQNAYIRTDNFIDEDGNCKTWEDVIRGVLQPLGVRMIQLRGMIFLYDFDGLYNSTDALTNHRVYWTSDSQNLAIDKTYNNIKITWSPYAQVDNMLPDEIWDESEDTPVEKIAINELGGYTYNTCNYYTYPLERGTESVFEAPGFTLWTTYQKSKNIELGVGRSVFKIVPQYDGDKCEGVMAFHRTFAKFISPGSTSYEVKIDSRAIGVNPIDLWSVAPNPNFKLFTTPKVLVPPQSESTPMQLRLTMECLVDCRINPFEEPFGVIPFGEGNCKANMERFNSRAQFLWIPIRIHWKRLGENVADYIYNNENALNNRGIKSFTDTINGTWELASTSNAFCWLAYYLPDANNRKENTPLCSFVGNRQCIGANGLDLVTLMQKMDDGQYIPYPDTDKAGEIWIEVMGNGWHVARYDATMGSADHNKFTQKVIEDTTFALVKMPTLELISTNMYATELNSSDVVYEAEVEIDAKEELSIDTICGTTTEGVPSARGCYYAENGTQILQMKRADRTATAEELLCGTLFSQYKGRKVALSGECRLDTRRYLSFSEDNQTENGEYKKFICVSDTEDLIRDTSEAKYVEFLGDIYDRE